MDSISKARQLLAEILEPGSSAPNTFYRILLLGIRDSHDYHKDLLAEAGTLDTKKRLKEYYQEALRFWRAHDRERSIYYLGGALYHLQDAWLGLSEDPSHEKYVERLLTLPKSGYPPEVSVKRKASPEEWVTEALEERQKLEPLLTGNPGTAEQRSGNSDQATLQLAHRAETAGAGLLLQFFLEALEAR